MTFSQFFEALWEKEPFPWQLRLADLALQGNWPRCIGLPTAAGKTALIDIAVYALAMGAPNAARRIFFVVDRRVIVDEAAERAEQLACKLRKAEEGSDLLMIADSLRAISGGEPIETAILRGGIPRDNSWAKSPLQTAVICSTIDQIGSSLLFRAYGASDYARPIRAALAVYDSLIILDEAHTSQPFAETLEWIRKYRGWAAEPLDRPLTMVEMSATPREGETFQERAEDLRHPVLSRRWQAEKRARLVEEPGDDPDALLATLVREARIMRDEHGCRVIGVIANRVLTARRVHESLRTDEGCEAILLTGRARPYDRDRIWKEWRDRIGMDRELSADPRKPVFVVATQAIEVGANIDFDALVTEIASMDAIEQRFGRLNRAGMAPISHAAIIAQKGQLKKSDDFLYGEASKASWDWLKQREAASEAGEKDKGKKRQKSKYVEMGVAALRSALNVTLEREKLVMPRQHAPVLMPAHVDLLSQTSPEPALSPEPSLFLHGPESAPADVQVIWRGDLDQDEPEQWPEIIPLCSPAAAEALSLPVWTVRKWLARESPADIADLEGTGTESDTPEQAIRPVVEWRSSDEHRIIDAAKDIRPGTTIVVPSTYGGCDKWGWNPDFLNDVTDIGDPVKLLAGRPTLRLDSRLVRSWNAPDFAGRIRAAEDPAELRALLRYDVAEDSSEWLRGAVKSLARSRRLTLIPNPDPDPASKWSAITGLAEFDQDTFRASYTTEVRLDEHLEGCEAWASQFTRDLPPRLRQTVIEAARLHDIGKADPRFQAWLRRGSPSIPEDLLAKSGGSGQNATAIERARRLAGYPKGGRHELMSVALLRDRRDEFPAIDFQLLLHLIESHHGRCRPFAPVVEDDDIPVSYRGWSASSGHRLERASSGVSERFWRLTRRYGWYGLAYLETLLRAADQCQSEAEQHSEADHQEAAHG